MNNSSKPQSSVYVAGSIISFLDLMVTKVIPLFPALVVGSFIIFGYYNISVWFMTQPWYTPVGLYLIVFFFLTISDVWRAIRLRAPFVPLLGMTIKYAVLAMPAAWFVDIVFVTGGNGFAWLQAEVVGLLTSFWGVVKTIVSVCLVYFFFASGNPTAKESKQEIKKSVGAVSYCQKHGEGSCFCSYGSTKHGL